MFQSLSVLFYTQKDNLLRRILNKVFKQNLLQTFVHMRDPRYKQEAASALC